MMSHSSTPHRDDPIRVLERLLVLCADGAAGYRHAAAMVKSPERLHQVLAQNAAHREEIESVLAYALVGLGEKPEHHGSIRGAVHRGWLDALAAFAPDAPNAIRAVLHECERGEQKTIEGFTAALGRSLPKEIHDAVQSQLGRVLEAAAALRRESMALDEPKPQTTS